jgi:hypothetical protein
MTTKRRKRLEEAREILKALGLLRGQQNERSALCLLALLDLRPGRKWEEAQRPLVGITPIMDWARRHYGRQYAPNMRETFRRYSMHQFVQAGIALYNPDEPGRPVNSPKAVYQIAPTMLDLIRSFGTPAWSNKLAGYLHSRETLAARYARDRSQKLVPVTLPTGTRIDLSPGAHNRLVRAVVEQFAPRFAPGSIPIYVGDTGDKWACFDHDRLAELGVHVDAHGKMPDVILHYTERNWLLLVECVTSHGPVDGKRHSELSRLFAQADPGRVFVTAFPDRVAVARYLSEIAWETEVWVADAPSHLIHFNGARFLGPHDVDE